MVSNSKDGEFISRICYKIGMSTIRGSSSRGGHEAMLELVELIRNNHKVFMLPDGPRGPRYCVKPGVIRMAQLTGRAIVPITVSTKRGIFLPSWDRFLVPLPGDSCVVILGKPIYVLAELSSEEFEKERLHLENVMNEIRIEADKLCGRDPEKEKLDFLKKKKKSDSDG